MRDFGGMVSFRVTAGERAAAEVCDRTRVFTLGESLGGVESPLEVPADLIRLSVGIEDASDLLDDLRQALG
jgi:cystathionine gamma-synthase